MIDACINMMVRNGEDCIEESLLSVLPYVKRAVVVIDSRSDDLTRIILNRIQRSYPNLEINEFKVVNPMTDLVEMRNLLLKLTTEKFGWIVDSDEIYPKEVVDGIAKTLAKQNGVLAYGFTSWGIWNKDKAHAQSSRRPTMRIYRNFDGLKWVGEFGKEKLKLGDIDLCYDYIQFPYKYIHLTHLKSDKWREELNMKRIADDRALVELPEDIKKLVKNYVEKKMQNVR